MHPTTDFQTRLARLANLVLVATAIVGVFAVELSAQRPTYTPRGAAPSYGGGNVRTVSATAPATTGDAPQVRKLPVPGAYARTLATKLGLRYRDQPGVTISPDAASEQLIVMAPVRTHPKIASDIRRMLDNEIRLTSATAATPLRLRLQNISWREFERDLKQVAGDDIPTTLQKSGTMVSFQLSESPMQGTLVVVDRRENEVIVQAPEPAVPGWKKIIGALDSRPARVDDVTEVVGLKNAEMAPIQRTMRLLKNLPARVKTPSPMESVFKNAVFQADQNSAPGAAGAEDAAPAPSEEPAGVFGDVQIQYVPELGQIILKGTPRDVERVKELIQEIEQKAELTQPDSEIVPLKHADANAVAALLEQLYDDVLSTRQGEVSITSLDSPNALLLIGRAEAIVSLKELIQKIDQPIEASSRLRVFRLQNASATDAELAIRGFFTSQPGNDDDTRPGLGTRVRVLADYRTNSLIISASPRDMTEVTRLINELDVQQTEATSELRVFPLNNAVAEDLAPTLQDAFIGTEVTGSDEVSRPSTSLSILSIDNEGQRVVESGILAGATITADPGANAIVVRAPSTSMPLIAELIRQLDRAPGIDSLVKVFTIENGDASQLTLSLETLFGSDAAATGTSVGAGNVAGLPLGTAAAESSLVPLRFSTDIRTNSIIASGSSADLEVVESILLRLDSEGFAERITEVIWLRNNEATLVADAITNYVSSRQQSQNTIQQYQQGLGPFDLLDRDIVAVAEPRSNSLLLSVSPRLYEEVRMLIDRLDRRRPMVLIKVILCEVVLEDAFEIGTELGLQDSLSFSRDQAVADIAGSAAAGVTGFNFNDAGVSNVNDVGRESFIGRSVSTFGLGQSNPAIGYGGFVLNAASESVSLLFRTLQDANRAQIISRPQLMTADNSPSLIEVGRQIARFRGTTVTNNNVTQNIEDIQVGLILSVTPLVGPDGLITVNVDITRSDRDDGNGTVVPDGSGGTVLIEDIIDTTVQATLAVYSGQTVIMGGLISTSRANFSRRLPLLSNIPLLGNLFKYDFEAERRNELLVVMTPMLVTGEQDLEYIKQTESSKMSWCLADVVEAHGDVGLSGGYGLWGPAVGPTIYPDLQPTIDGEVVVGNVPQGVVSRNAVGGSLAPVVSDPAGTMQSRPLPIGAGSYETPQSTIYDHLPEQRYSLPDVENLDEPLQGTIEPPVLSPGETLQVPSNVDQSSFQFPSNAAQSRSRQTLPASWTDSSAGN